MLTDEILSEAKELVAAWVKHWTREGRLDGGLDKFARADLEEKIAGALAKAAPKPKAKKGKADE
jgi:hypothetical protein